MLAQLAFQEKVRGEKRRELCRAARIVVGCLSAGTECELY